MRVSIDMLSLAEVLWSDARGCASGNTANLRVSRVLCALADLSLNLVNRLEAWRLSFSDKGSTLRDTRVPGQQSALCTSQTPRSAR